MEEFFDELDQKASNSASADRVQLQLPFDVVCVGLVGDVEVRPADVAGLFQQYVFPAVCFQHVLT